MRCVDLSQHARRVEVDVRGGFHREGHNWLHWDRRPSDPIHRVQGFVNLLDTPEGGVAFQALPKSHRYQGELAERFPSTATQRFFLLE